MTKKDYELIAMAVLNAHEDADNEVEQLGIVAVANNLADRLGMAEPKFNRDKFLTACGIED